MSGVSLFCCRSHLQACGGGDRIPPTRRLQDVQGNHLQKGSQVIQYKCAKCGATLESPDSMVGQQDNCPMCGQAGVVPSPQAMAVSASAPVVTATGVACRNHPTVAAVDRCAACAEAFCPNCLVEVQGRKYCGNCKVLAVQGQPAAYQGPTKTCGYAIASLVLSLVGLVVCGIILEILALVYASKAKTAIRQNPQLTGSGMATAGMVIGIIGLVLGVIQVFYFASRGTH